MLSSNNPDGKMENPALQNAEIEWKTEKKSLSLITALSDTEK